MIRKNTLHLHRNYANVRGVVYYLFRGVAQSG